MKLKLKPNTIEACKKILFHCGNLTADESLLIITDDSTKDIGNIIYQISLETNNNSSHKTIKKFNIHGEEPPADISEMMYDCDLIIGLTSMSMAHTQARFRATNNGSRYLSLPDYSWKIVEDNSLKADFRELLGIAEKIGKLLDNSDLVRITTDLGTDIQLSISGRKANRAPGWCFGPGTIASPPDAEVNIAPVENLTSGTIVVDGSIPCNEIGLLSEPIFMKVENGLVTDINGYISVDLTKLFDKDDNINYRKIGEFGIGLNPKAKLCGLMLPDEGCLGTIHFGIGSNATIGGKNNVPFHLDHIIKDPTIVIDNQMIMDSGRMLNF